MDDFIYRGEKAREISFPIGGIGSGCIGLAGNGQLIDMEIFNRPNKGSHAGMSHFAVKVEDENGGSVLDTRVINGDSFTPYTGKYGRPHFNSYGFGSDRATLAGLPHFKNCTFKGEYPIATLEFADEKFPGRVRMTAFNPLIPTNEDDSSLPAAFFEFELTNTQERELTYTVGFTMNNLYAKHGGIHSITETDGLHLLHMTNTDYPKSDVAYGDLCIGTDAGDTFVQQYWYRGNWFDNLMTYWRDFSSPGAIKNRIYTDRKKDTDPNYAGDDLGVLTARCTLGAGEKKKLRFIMTWNCPNFYNYWNPEVSEEEEKKRAWKNYYATLFADAKESAVYALKNWERLYRDTKLFKDTLFDSSMPKEALDAVSANISILKSPTCIRLQNGELYGFEGNHVDEGCCEGSCTHVWSYTYALAFLFPRLERSMRNLEYTHSMRTDGSMGFRLMLPLGREPNDFHACADGQMATIMRVYREYKISGDKKWLAKLWPNVKRTLEYAWSPENKDKWDLDKDGIMEGRQHHTLDMELFGEDAWLSGLYLGALKAASVMAGIMGDTEREKEYTGIFEAGKKKLNTELWNGEYFIQKIDLHDKSVLQRFEDGGTSLQRQGIYDAYWNEEQGELMYQIGEGCGIDQVLGQWHANLIGLGEIFEKDKVDSALRSIYKYNFITARDHFNPCRLYCLNDEQGLTICAWPEGKVRPLIGAPYSEETMHGFEYQAASHMIQEGFEIEGMTCIRALRERYDGKKRNPWNEYECGSNYARSMASYALLLTYSGFRYDMGRGMIGFCPIHPEHFSSFWSVDGGWGSVRYEEKKVTVDVLYGTISLCALSLGSAGECVRSVVINGKAVAYAVDGDEIVFDEKQDVGEIVVEYR